MLCLDCLGLLVKGQNSFASSQMLLEANASFLLLITKKKILFCWQLCFLQLLFYGKQYWYIAENVEVPSVTITSSKSGSTSAAASAASGAGGSASPSSLHPSSHRRKKPKRRSTGVVNLDVDVSSPPTFQFALAFASPSLDMRA